MYFNKILEKSQRNFGNFRAPTAAKMEESRALGRNRSQIGAVSVFGCLRIPAWLNLICQGLLWSVARLQIFF